MEPRPRVWSAAAQVLPAARTRSGLGAYLAAGAGRAHERESTGRQRAATACRCPRGDLDGPRRADLASAHRFRLHSTASHQFLLSRPSCASGGDFIGWPLLMLMTGDSQIVFLPLAPHCIEIGHQHPGPSFLRFRDPRHHVGEPQGRLRDRSHLSVSSRVVVGFTCVSQACRCRAWSHAAVHQYALAFYCTASGACSPDGALGCITWNLRSSAESPLSIWTTAS